MHDGGCHAADEQASRQGQNEDDDLFQEQKKRMYGAHPIKLPTYPIYEIWSKTR